MPAAWVTGLLRSGRALEGAGGGVLSALGAEERGSPYDRKAATYDRLVGNRLYNRVVWGTSPASYAAFAAAAAGDSDGLVTTALDPRDARRRTRKLTAKGRARVRALVTEARRLLDERAHADG